MKRIMLIACATLGALTSSFDANAAQIGPYLGAGAGMANLRTPNHYSFAAPAENTRTRGGWGERIFIGFNVDPYLGIEAGYANYPRSLYIGRQASNYSSITYNARTYDLVGKAYLPLGASGFNIYVLAGAARVAEILKYVNSPIGLTGSIATPIPGTTNTFKTRPIYGLGINYDFNRHLVANVELTQIQHLNTFSNKPNSIPFMNLATVNLAYKFC